MRHFSIIFNSSPETMTFRLQTKSRIVLVYVVHQLSLILHALALETHLIALFTTSKRAFVMLRSLLALSLIYVRTCFLTITCELKSCSCGIFGLYFFVCNLALGFYQRNVFHDHSMRMQMGLFDLKRIRSSFFKNAKTPREFMHKC
jgi:hypothetical protein